jgi:sigma-B regulation protein RsbU (phosphoserine phosphatase)
VGATSPVPPGAPEGVTGAAAPLLRRRRPFLRAFARALSDPRTFDLRRNPSLWLGFVLAIPIPVLLFLAGAPPLVRVVSLVAPVGWAVILGAAGRVALLAEEELRRLAELAVASEKARAHLTQEVETERSLREELEATQRLMDAELRLAQGIHDTLVPSDVVRPDLQVVVRHVPCSYVGGDYLQASLPKPNLLYLCVGDVSGHGVAAALVVSRIHGLVRRLIFEERTPEQFLEEMNRAALRIFRDSYFFMTFGVFRIDLAARRIDYATAGHPAQILVRAEGPVETLSTPNRLLGIDADIFDPERPSDSVAYEPGDTLVLFTDGLFEIPAKDGSGLLGEAGLYKIMGTLRGLPTALVAGEILQDLAAFQGDSRFEDDVSLIVTRFEPSAVPVAGREGEAATPRAEAHGILSERSRA